MASGVRRIEAYTGARVEEMMDNLQDSIRDLKALFNNAPDLGGTIRKYIEEKQFAPGSMLPKVEAAVKFAESKPGRTSLITLLEKAKDGIEGKTGTRVHQ